MISLDAAKAVRDTVIKRFSKRQFKAGLKMLEDAGPLPRFIELECIGTLHFYKRELQQAVQNYESAISEQSEYGIARYQYLVGTQEERQGDLVAAFKRYQAAIEMEPTFVDSYVELGGLLVKVGDFEGAAHCYRDAVRLDPGDMSAHENLRLVLSKLTEDSPDQFSNELRSVEVECQRLQDAGATGSSTGKW
ncbi:hypothetical protein CDL60_28520 [Roseateles noduli]|nr:hypothetical protein CDL60_28520 [Roseateles noduli]